MGCGGGIRLRPLMVDYDATKEKGVLGDKKQRYVLNCGVGVFIMGLKQ
jgi:hypothetical protein